MNTIEHLKVITAEELSELISAATKCQTYLFKNLRFGDHAISPVNQIPSWEETVQEATDVIAMLEMLSEEYCDQQIFNRERIEAKKTKVRLMMQRAREHGALAKYMIQFNKSAEVPVCVMTCEEFVTAKTCAQNDLGTGVGFWATEKFESTLRTSTSPQPEWATHVHWYPLNFGQLPNKS